jgi:hypothetical protein
MNITQGQFHRKPRPTWIETLWTWVLMLCLMVPLAWMFVTGLEKQEFVDQARLAKHMDSILLQGQISTDVTPPKAPTGLKPNYGDLSEPRTRVFQDASSAKKGGK